ncbi:MAG: hypothetical protein WDZ51_05500 [Pirellulaceae bacterium]
MSSISFSLAMLLPLLGAQPQSPAVQDRVDLLEINHYHDAQGRLVFDQVIFYEWSARDARFHVTAWRLLKSPWQLPRRRWSDGMYESTWNDGDVTRHVVAEVVRETWTQYDPEMVEREYLPREYRRGLSRKISKLTPELSSVAVGD